MTIYCYGDSNTWGYDPCGFFGGEYTHPWPSLLPCMTINGGRNGRMIPDREHEVDILQRDLISHQADLLIVMLGTNDLLNGTRATVIATRMEMFLSHITLPILLIAPPPLQRGAWVPDDELVEGSRAVAKLYNALCERKGYRFADAAEWNIDLTFDGVHFTEEGHIAFARGLTGMLDTIEPLKQTITP